MELIYLCITAFGASLLTFYSGFGLGTLLLPVFGLYYEMADAVVLTSFVHLFNNSYKWVLVRKSAQMDLALKFAIAAIPAAFLGSWCIGWLEITGPDLDFRYAIADRQFQTDVVNIVLGVLMLAFALIELLPALRKLSFAPKWIYFGGALSGFFGGMSGHQGALRSAFLMQLNLSREAFVATGVMIALCIDLTRIPGYLFSMGNYPLPWSTILAASLSAALGSWLGNRFLKKARIEWLRNFVAAFLLVMAVVVALGWAH